nr:uncharacterized protein LOC127321355 [Lolium perenne]
MPPAAAAAPGPPRRRLTHRRARLDPLQSLPRPPATRTLLDQAVNAIHPCARPPLARSHAAARARRSICPQPRAPRPTTPRARSRFLAAASLGPRVDHALVQLPRTHPVPAAAACLASPLPGPAPQDASPPAKPRSHRSEPQQQLLRPRTTLLPLGPPPTGRPPSRPPSPPPARPPTPALAARANSGRPSRSPGQLPQLLLAARAHRLARSRTKPAPPAEPLTASDEV